MRKALLAIAALVATVALAPAAHASAQVCTSATSECPALLCKDDNGDRVYQRHECAHPEDHFDPCAFRSDCCGGPLGGGFWCPEDS